MMEEDYVDPAGRRPDTKETGIGRTRKEQKRDKSRSLGGFQNFQPRRVDTVDLSLPVRLLFSSREKETHSKNSPVNKLSKLWYFHVFLSQITLLNFSAIESRVKILLLCFSTLSLSLCCA